VRDVVAAMPTIQANVLRETYYSKLGMPKRALEIIGPKRVQQQHPSLMKRFKQCKRNFCRRRARILKLGPSIFVIRFDGRLIFGERKLEPAVAVQVTIGHVMHDLPDSPPAGSIRRVELLLSQPFNRGSKLRGRFGYFVNRSPHFFIGGFALKLETSYRVP